MNAQIDHLKTLNSAYRAGAPMVPDQEYDRLRAAALLAFPADPFFLEPEPEGLAVGQRVKLPVAMLSTDKAYTTAEVAAFVARVVAAATALGIDPASVSIRVEPKLDGIAAHDDGELVLTRGKGGYGTDISRWFNDTYPVDGGRGEGFYKIQAQRGRGAGEIVVPKGYFDSVLAPRYDLDHPRNYCAGLVASETIQAYHEEALLAGKVRLVNYDSLDFVTLTAAELPAEWERIFDYLIDRTEYVCDGVVAAVIDPAIRAHMGATSHHHRWQIALKRNDVEGETEQLSTTLQTGRTGRVTPVLNVSPVDMYGVTITNVTAHTARHLLDMGLGKGAKLVITRAGGVIPRLLRVTTPGTLDVELTRCPSCGGETAWDGPYLVCPHSATCPAQAARTIEHFAKTLTVMNGFGPTVTEALVRAGITKISAILTMDSAAFVAAGISSGIAANLVKETTRARYEPISEAIWLGAWGVRNLGRGDSRKLLEQVSLYELHELTVERLQSIKGFGPETSAGIVSDLKKLWPELLTVLKMGWTLDPVVKAASVASPISGMTLVFTGAMSGSRDAMEAEARALRATVGSSVSKKTTILVCGGNVGAAKTAKAKDLGVRTMTEEEYREMLIS